MDELRELFGDYLARGSMAAVNFDNAEARTLAENARNVVSFGVDYPEADIGVKADSIVEDARSIAATLVDRRNGATYALSLPMPGRHNLSNALAAIAGSVAAGVGICDAVTALASFKGLARRFDIVGTTASGVTVIDDFGHNPEKCRATLRTLKSQPGRIIAFFQPHGYGPLRQMGHELAETFAQELGPDDITIMCDPVYFGGTVDRSEGTGRIIKLIQEAGGHAEHIPERNACGDRIVQIARPGDRIVIMGARDDTLSQFASRILQDI
jgi:UDP-N-acetylmuramate--alanine ligase